MTTTPDGTLLGPAGIAQKYSKKVWSYWGGERESFEIVGPRSLVEAAYAIYKVAAGNNPKYDELAFDPGTGLASLRVGMTQDGPVKWELWNNEVQDPLYMAPQFNSLTDDDLVNAQTALAHGIPGSATGFKGLLRTYYGYLSFNRDQYQHSQWALRWSQNVSARSQVALDNTNKDKVTALPDSAKLNTLLGLQGVTGGEWLQKASSASEIGAHRWQLSGELWHALAWAKIPYGGTWEPKTA